MAKFSNKVMGKEVGSASVYAQPHNMSGKPENVNDSLNNGGFRPDPNTMTAKGSVPGGTVPTRRVSLGDPTAPAKTTGIKIRGTGAATKGVMARGPMA
jgi:hypothetical protein